MANPDPETREVMLFSPEVAACPQAVYRELVSKCPVAHQSFGGGPVISRYEDVSWALRHPEIFSSEMEMEMKLGTERPMIPQQIDPPSQTRYRKILDPRFSKKRMLEIAPDVRRHANELIDGFHERGECEFDQDFAVPLPCTAFLSLMGLPQSELPLFLRLKDGIIRPQSQIDGEVDLEKMEAHRERTGKEIYAYFEDVIEARRKDPGDDMVSYLLETEVDGHRLSARGHPRRVVPAHPRRPRHGDGHPRAATWRTSRANPAQRERLVARSGPDPERRSRS